MHSAEMLDHRKFGLHSNIPECCIDEFISYDNDYIAGVNYIPYAWFRWSQFGLLEDEYSNIEYVPCQKCMSEILSGKLTPAKIHMCDNTCIDTGHSTYINSMENSK